MNILNIRGTSGSGKSTLVRQLMDTRPERTLLHLGGVKNEVGYQCSGPGMTSLTVIGPYRTQCGGCDQIKTQDQVCDLVRRNANPCHGIGCQYAADIDMSEAACEKGRCEYAKVHGHVVFEGLLITGNYARYKALAEELGKERFIFAFLDTPFEVCCARIDARRAEKGKGPLEDHSNTRAKWDASRTVARKYEADGLRVVWLDHRDPLPQVTELLP